MTELEKIKSATASAHAPTVTIVHFDEKKKEVNLNLKEESIDGK